MSDRVHAGLPSSDPDGFFECGDEDLSIANAPGLGRATDRLHRFLNHVVAEHNLDLPLGKEIKDVFGPAVKLGMALLASEASRFGHGDPLQSDLLQRLLHFIELERLDDRFDLFHGVSLAPCGLSASRLQEPAALSV